MAGACFFAWSEVMLSSFSNFVKACGTSSTGQQLCAPRCTLVHSIHQHRVATMLQHRHDQPASCRQCYCAHRVHWCKDGHATSRGRCHWWGVHEHVFQLWQ
jgi:hypothetical protein